MEKLLCETLDQPMGTPLPALRQCASLLSTAEVTSHLVSLLGRGSGGPPLLKEVIGAWAEVMPLPALLGVVKALHKEQPDGPPPHKLRRVDDPWKTAAGALPVSAAVVARVLHGGTQDELTSVVECGVPIEVLLAVSSTSTVRHCPRSNPNPNPNPKGSSCGKTPHQSERHVAVTLSLEAFVARGMIEEHSRTPSYLLGCYQHQLLADLACSPCVGTPFITNSTRWWRLPH
jgi:hypothetical protein